MRLNKLRVFKYYFRVNQFIDFLGIGTVTLMTI